jgi:hypothetical protein
MPPASGPTIGSAVSVDRPGPPVKSADGAAHHPGRQAVTLPPGEAGVGRGRQHAPGRPAPDPDHFYLDFCLDQSRVMKDLILTELDTAQEAGR